MLLIKRGDQRAISSRDEEGEAKFVCLEAPGIKYQTVEQRTSRTEVQKNEISRTAGDLPWTTNTYMYLRWIPTTHRRAPGSSQAKRPRPGPQCIAAPHAASLWNSEPRAYPLTSHICMAIREALRTTHARLWHQRDAKQKDPSQLPRMASADAKQKAGRVCLFVSPFAISTDPLPSLRV